MRERQLDNFSVETGADKSKWFGPCRLCGVDNRLSTVKIHTSVGINYTILRSCDECISIVRNNVDHAISFIHTRARMEEELTQKSED